MVRRRRVWLLGLGRGDAAARRLPRRADARARARRLVDRVRRARRCAGFYETELTRRAARTPCSAHCRSVRGDERERGPLLTPAGAVELARGPVARRSASAHAAWRAVPSRGAARAGARVVQCRSRAELPRPLEEIERELDEKLPAWQEHGPRAPRVPPGRRAAEAQRPIGRSSARPLVPRADVVPRLEAEPAQHLPRDAEREPLWQ